MGLVAFDDASCADAGAGQFATMVAAAAAAAIVDPAIEIVSREGLRLRVAVGLAWPGPLGFGRAVRLSMDVVDVSG